MDQSLNDRIIPLSGSKNGKPIFCIHPGAGFGTVYQELAKAYGPARSIWGIQAKGLANDEAPESSMREMASDYIELIKSVQKDGPYTLLGWSIGGRIAHEIAAQLERGEELVERVILLDTQTPSESEESIAHENFEEAAKNLFKKWRSGENEGPSSPVNTHSERVKFLKAQLIKDGLIPAGSPDEIATQVLQQLINNSSILVDHTLAAINAPLILFKAGIRNGSEKEVMDWDQYTKGGLEEITINVSHYRMLDEEPAKLIAQHLKGLL
jgi:thioesterase domain-containing protein